jgi:hypothetical protein
MTSTSTVRDLSHRNVKISHRAGIVGNFSHRMVTNFHRAVILTGREFAYDKLITLCWRIYCTVKDFNVTVIKKISRRTGTCH